MKFYLFIIMITMFSFDSYAQVYNIIINKNDSMPTLVRNCINMDDVLTDEEGEFLNKVAQINNVDFDFIHKKIAFFNSPGGKVLHNKNDFFSQYTNGRKTMIAVLVIFSRQESLDANNYDAAFVYDSKILRSTSTLIREIKNNL